MPSKMTSTLAAALVLVSALWLAGCGQSGAPASAPAGAEPPRAELPRAVPAPAPALPDHARSVPKRARPPMGEGGPPPPGAGQGAPPPIPLPAPPPPPPVTARSAPACAAADLAPFPWPIPPRPSVTATIAPYLLFGSAPGATTLSAVAARLEGAIARAGYLQPKYLGLGCDGFAIVLDLEHIAADGARSGGAAGFAPPGQEEGFSLAGYVKRLFYAPPGHYRQIVFVVSDLRMRQTTASPTAAELRAIARDGMSALPAGFAALPYTPRHLVLALIYEFEKGPRDGDARVVPPDGRLGAEVHLRKARLF